MPPKSLPSRNTAVTRAKSTATAKTPSDSSSEITTVFSNLPEAPTSAEEKLMVAAAYSTSKLGDMVGKMNDFCDDVKEEGSLEQKLAAIDAMKEVIVSETAINASYSGKMCIDNINKRLHLAISGQLSNIVSNDPTTASCATTYKITFKPIELSSDRPVIDPLEELYDATSELEVQVTDSQSTVTGHVIYIQNQIMFEAAFNSVLHHVVKSTRKPLTDYFNIHHQINSAYAVKTHTFNKSILREYDLLTTIDNKPTPKVNETKQFLRKYNKGWFSSEIDIENIEIFGLQKPGDDPLITMKIHVSHNSFKKFICAKTTNIMLRKHKIRIYEEVPVVQCLRCCNFRHTWKLCTSTSRCRFCGQNDDPIDGHKSANCPNRSTPKCCNCLDSGKDESESKHPATSFACPLLKNEAERLRREAKQKAMATYLYN